MFFIESAKNFYSYLVQGNCRRHGRELTEVWADGHCASTMPVCLDCHPRYRDQVVVKPARTKAEKLIAVSDLAAVASHVTVPELTEVEVG